jgi:mannuronan 5-epimerase
MIALIRNFLLTLLSFSSLILLGQVDFNKVEIEAQQQQVSTTSSSSSSQNNSCIKYDHVKRMIIISCKSSTLTDVSNKINNYAILDKQPNGVWLLNSNITINPRASLTIDPKDTTWLKIISDEKTLAYGIHIKGSLKIDSVKVTSWNPKTNNFAMSYGSRESSGAATKDCGSDCPIEIKDLLTHKGAPRPYLIVEPSATGTTNITNSYIGYIGYEAGWGKKQEGIHYNAGDGSIIRNNNFDHLYFGFYSVGVGPLLYENNMVHDSGHYGIDPHTGTHDMIIRNNTVYNNNGTAIICSLNCYNITYENNKIHDNNGAGISFSRNNTNSIARNNIINNQETPIEVSASNNNEVYNNAISKSPSAGITVKAGSSENKIYNNIIDNTQDVGIKISPDSKNNSIYSNKINGITQQALDTKSQSDKVKKQSSKSSNDGKNKK